MGGAGSRKAGEQIKKGYRPMILRRTPLPDSTALSSSLDASPVPSDPIIVSENNMETNRTSIPSISKETSQYAWTSGEMQGIKHMKLIGAGGGGEVHKVLAYSLFTQIANRNRCLTRKLNRLTLSRLVLIS